MFPLTNVVCNHLYVSSSVRTDPNLPQLVAAGWEYRDNPTYHLDGRTRSDHATCIVQYTFAGRGILETAGKRYVIEPEQAFLAEVPGDHRYYLPPGWAPWEFAYLSFDGEDLRRHIRWLLDCQHPVLHLTPQHPLLAQFYNLFLFIQQHQTFHPEALAAPLYRFVVELRTLATQPGRSHSPAFNAVMRYIAEHFTDTLTLAELAIVAELSVSHFCSRFHREVGLTPLEYLTRLRLRHALLLLRGTSLSLEAISQRCGFQNPSYFGKVFRKVLGVTPHRYRCSTPPDMTEDTLLPW